MSASTSTTGTQTNDHGEKMIHRPKLALRVRILLGVAAMAVGVAVALPSAATAALPIESFYGEVVDENGEPETQAGAHPYSAMTGFRVPLDANDRAVEDVKTTKVHLPPGFVGNPQATPRCPLDAAPVSFFAPPLKECPANTQVGLAHVDFSGDLPPGFFYDIDGLGVAGFPIYNMEPPPGVPARFGFNVVVPDVFIDAQVRPGDFGLDVTVRDASQSIFVRAVEVEFWGVPADSTHDPARVGAGCPFFSGGCSAGVAAKPFLSNPTDCAAGRLTTSLELDSWQTPGVFSSASFDEDRNGNPMEVVNCEVLDFSPKLEAQPTTRVADAPTGLEVDLAVPQNDNPAGLASAHLKRATVTLPEGMTISPAAADGLASCTDAQLNRASSQPAGCPDSSRIGTAVVDTPLLDQPLGGSVYVMSQQSDDPESGSMYRLALELRSDERGVVLKLPGQIHASAATGRLVTTFDNNPQLPFDSMKLRFKGGPRAPLATPTECGRHTVDSTLTSWSGKTVELSNSFTIDCPGATGFAPPFAAGSVSPTGGEFSPFAVRIGRDDRQQFLSGVSVDLPEGLLAKLRGVPLCGSSAAENGGCPAGSRIGTATVGAGPGSNPFHLKGDVFLTEGYKGGAYGLAAHVHAKAGPFDLGWVRVRQALYVDPVTAGISVVSDPLPQIVKGVPVRLRSVNVDVDRPDFTINPTSCSTKQVEATLTSIDGAVHKTSSRFQAGDCQALGFRPRLAMRLLGRKQTRTGGHPALKAVVSQGAGQANIGRAEVALPKSVVLDPNNSTDPKLLCGYDEGLKADCPASSVIGNATAQTPLLNKPLTGKVHLVQGIRFGKAGNRIRTTPSLLVKLRGEVDIDLRARTTVKKNRLVTIFPDVPDARVSKFSMQINGGRKGILVVTRTRKAKIDVCNAKQTADVKTDGHNGKRADFATRLKTPCGGERKAASKRK